MTSDSVQKLHWTQRVALVRHNLHSARRTGDYNFFKSLQVHALVEGTDHVALLYSTLGDDGDSILSTLDNLNAGIAYVHQDAFKAVYDNIKAAMPTTEPLPHRKSLVRVDISQQRDMADHAIDKTTNSAIHLIQAQSVPCQDAIANVWVTGVTIIADAVCVCLKEMNNLEDKLDDFICLEYSWNCVQSSVDASVSALRGIFSLMALSNIQSGVAPTQGRQMSVSSSSSDHPGSVSVRSRNSSTSSAFNFIKRALSHSNLQPSLPGSYMCSGSIALPIAHPSFESSPGGFRASMSAAVPTKMSTLGNHPHTVLSTIPPTPAIDDASEDLPDSSHQPDDYFSFTVNSESPEHHVSNRTPSCDQDLLQMYAFLPPPSLLLSFHPSRFSFHHLTLGIEEKGPSFTLP